MSTEKTFYEKMLDDEKIDLALLVAQEATLVRKMHEIRHAIETKHQIIGSLETIGSHI